MHRQMSNEKEMRKIVEELQDSKQLCTTVENELNAQISTLGMSMAFYELVCLCLSIT